MFTCTFCAKAFDCQRRLNVHMVSHTKEKPHKCLYCAASFGIEGYLQKHVKSFHGGIKAIKKRNTHCPLCSYKCYSKTYLERHLRKHSAELPFSCDISSCGFKTKYKSALVRHVRAVHNDERPYECPSDGCDYKAKTTQYLKKHLRTHSTEKLFACTVAGCKVTCKTYEGSVSHTARAHTEEKAFTCSTCGFQTKTKRDLVQHQNKHKEIQRFQCKAPNCGYATFHKSQFGLHLARKHRTKNVTCTAPGCSFRCGSIYLLKIHLKGHEKPIFKCPANECNFSTRFKNNLLKHISRHHDELQSATAVEPGKLVLEGAGAHAVGTLHCRYPNCGFQTQFPHQYDRHKITHSKVCAFCYSRFSHLSNLKAHLQRHIGEKPYSCSHCKYTAVSSGELKVHAGKIHHIFVIARGKDDQVRNCRRCSRNCLSYSEFVLHSLSHLRPVVVLERLRVHIV